MVIKEFNRDPQRYMNLIIQSDKRMQLLMFMFIADNIIDGSVTELLRKFPREVILDSKAINKSKDKEYIKDFISKYSLNESDYSLENYKEEETIINIKPNDTIKQFVEDNSVANIRQRRLEEELGL